jgi:hypothetical protein
LILPRKLRLELVGVSFDLAPTNSLARLLRLT